MSLTVHGLLAATAAVTIAYSPQVSAPTAPAAAVLGDSFLVPDEEETDDESIQKPSIDAPELPHAGDLDSVAASPQPSLEASAVTDQSVGSAPSRAPKAAAQGGTSRPAQSAPPTRGSESEVPALFGAAGDRSAVDLATAFVRAFPQATSADPGWSDASLGAAGDVMVFLTLNESGTIVSHEVRGTASATMRQGVERTLSLLRARSFTAKSAITKLHLTCNVSADAVHDGLHGDVFAIGASFAGGEGNGFFALAIGRRIDVTAYLVR